MLSTTQYNRGEVVLVNFVFSEGAGARRRPAVILSGEAYHAGRQEAIVAAITSNTERILVGDHLIADWRQAGLLFPSVATGVIITIKQGMITRALGRLSFVDIDAIDDPLRLSLGLRD